MVISILPTWLLKYLYKDYFKQQDLNILLSNLLIIIIFLSFKNTIIGHLNIIPHFCLFNKLFSIQCPFCVITRAFCELSNTNFAKAFYLNCCSILFALFIILQIPLRFFLLFNEKNRNNINRFSQYFGNAILIITLAIWLFKLRY